MSGGRASVRQCLYGEVRTRPLQ